MHLFCEKYNRESHPWVVTHMGFLTIRSLQSRAYFTTQAAPVPPPALPIITPLTYWVCRNSRSNSLMKRSWRGGFRDLTIRAGYFLVWAYKVLWSLALSFIGVFPPCFSHILLAILFFSQGSRGPPKGIPFWKSGLPYLLLSGKVPPELIKIHGGGTFAQFPRATLLFRRKEGSSGVSIISANHACPIEADQKCLSLIQ